MSQPRRRRRSRRRRGGGSAANRTEQQPTEQQPTEQLEQQAAAGERRRPRRRRGRPRSEQQHALSPKSSEDLVRALPKDRPQTLTAPHDGQRLEEIIGELQSEWGVPQYPQEYRITVKVADERDAKERPAPVEETRPQPDEQAPAPGAPRREKAPAAPVAGGPVREHAPRRRRRGRRGGKGTGSG